MKLFKVGVGILFCWWTVTLWNLEMQAGHAQTCYQGNGAVPCAEPECTWSRNSEITTACLVRHLAALEKQNAALEARVKELEQRNNAPESRAHFLEHFMCVEKQQRHWHRDTNTCHDDKTDAVVKPQ